MSAIIPVFIPHVGCPHDCVFCNQKKIAGTLTAPDGGEVSKIIEAALEYAGENAQVAFYGGSFTAIPLLQMKEYLAAAKAFMDDGRVSSIRLSTRPDCIDEKRLEILKEYGVKVIELGAQSMCESVLLKSGRGHTKEDTVCAAKLIKKHGFGLVLQMMTHLPGSDDEKDIETANELSALSPDGVRIYPTVVIRDTALEALWREGKYTPATPEAAAELGAEIIDIFKKKKIPIIRFGLNPTDDLSSGEALCGAYHPALGEMAQSERYKKACVSEIEKKGLSGGRIEIRVNSRRVSALVGQKKKNKIYLTEKYGFESITVSEDENLSDGEVAVFRIGK